MYHLEHKYGHMAAISLAGNYCPGANQHVNTCTIDIPSSKIESAKESLQNILESKIKNISQSSQKSNFRTLKLDC